MFFHRLKSSPTSTPLKMMNFFRKFILGSNFPSESPSLVELKDHTSDYKVEIFFFNFQTREWAESISGSLSIDKFGKPKKSFIVIKTEASYPYNFIRKITRDFELIPRDEKTWMFRVSLQNKNSEYKERQMIACRFLTPETAKRFNHSIKYIQSGDTSGFENLTFRLEIIRRIHEREILERKAALFANFPPWDDLINGKYYKSFYSKGDSFGCSAEVREFDYSTKEWSKIFLGVVKIENLESSGRSVLTVIENQDLVRHEITLDVELIAIDDRTWMWRGYKKCKKDVKSLLIGCRFISSKLARCFMEAVIQAQVHAPSRCAFRDEYMSALFKKEFQVMLEENQAALEKNFPGEYEITELEDEVSPDLEDCCLPSTSKEDPLKPELAESSSKCPKTASSISLYSYSISSDKKNSLNVKSKMEILCEFKTEFVGFDSFTKKWKDSRMGILKIIRDVEFSKIIIVIKPEESEEKIVSKITLDLQLIEKGPRILIWRTNIKDIVKESLVAIKFEDAEIAEEFKNAVKTIQDIYATELPSDEFELEILKKLYEGELEEISIALEADFPSHVDLSWLDEPDISKLRENTEISETRFSKGALFSSKADLYKFDNNSREWKRLTALPGFVSIKRKRFQEFQKTLIYAVSDEFKGRIVVKCEIGSNLELKLKNKSTWIFRGYVEIEHGDLESFLVASRFSNSVTSKSFKKIVEEVQQHSPWRCFFRDQFLAGLLKKESESVAEENEIALNLNLNLHKEVHNEKNNVDWNSTS